MESLLGPEASDILQEHRDHQEIQTGSSRLLIGATNPYTRKIACKIVPVAVLPVSPEEK